MSQILAQVGIGVTLKSYHTLSSFFLKPKDLINFEKQRRVVYQITCLDYNLCM